MNSQRRHAPLFCLWALWLGLFATSALADLADTITRIKPSIVAVGSFSKTDNPQFVFRGTGFIVGNGQLVATNAHVVPEMLNQDAEMRVLAMQYRTENAGTSRFHVRPVQLIAKDPEHDLAILKFTGPALPALSIKSSTDMREGQNIAFTGFPIGGALGYSPVTHQGSIAAITPIALPGSSSKTLNARVLRQLKNGLFNIFQLDATAYPGSSGSPVYLPETGEIIGVINMVMLKSTREAALSNPSGISYALPANLLLELLQTIQP